MTASALVPVVDTKSRWPLLFTVVLHSHLADRGASAPAKLAMIVNDEGGHQKQKFGWSRRLQASAFQSAEQSMLSGFLNKAVIDICCEAEHSSSPSSASGPSKASFGCCSAKGQQRLAKGLAVVSSVAEARPRRGSLCSVPAVQGNQRREDDAGKAWSSRGQGQEKPQRTHGESRERRDAREIPASSSMRTAPSPRIPQTPAV